MKQLTHTLFKRALINLTLIFLSAMPAMAASSTPYNWQNVAIGGGGFVSSVIADPNEPDLFYARTDVGGAYRWKENSQSWIPLLDWVDADERGLLGIEAIAVDPVTPGTVYMMAGTNYWNQADDGIGRSAFLRSHDYGATWEKIYVWDNTTKNFNVHGNGMGRGNGEALAIDPGNSDVMFYGSKNKGLWTSADNGNTWSKVSSFPVDSTWNGSGISFVTFDPSTTVNGKTTRLYVGVLEEGDNVFVSDDAGKTWSVVPNRPVPQYAPRLMPQRISVRPDGSALYITFGDGAGPHTMQWDEGWGPINDWFNRGAVYKYDVSSQTWTDISPQNLINPEGDGDYTDPSTYYGCYSGISVDPKNPDHMVVSSIASYRGPQYWFISGAWSDRWGDNLFVTEDGGKTWVPSFEYYWLEGGMEPPVQHMDENGVPWIVGNTIHWIGGVVIDPHNPKRVFITSGNGVFITDNIFNYEWSYENEWGQPDISYTQRTVWKFAGHGIEETVPEDIVSMVNGPLISVIADYDGFVHTDVTEYPASGRHTTIAAGAEFSLGSTTGLAYAPLSGKLAKVARVRSVSTEYTTIPIGPVQYSTDNGETWTVETYTTSPPANLNGGKLALSADGAVTLWMPETGTTLYRHSGSAWTEVNGISFNGRPAADWNNPSLFYVYNNTTGYMYVSTDAGVSFSQAGHAGASHYRTARTVPGKTGHIWVPIAADKESQQGGLMRSTDGGATFSAVPGVDYCEAVGFGKAADGATYPTAYVFAKIDGITGIWRSVDEGASWLRVNDDNHEYGGLANGEFVRGDMNVFGRVYMSTAGRGIVYGEPTGQSVAVTGVDVASPTAITVGETHQLTATVYPADATNTSVTWISGDPSVATVNSYGTVTGVKQGNVTITVTTVDGGYTATAALSVKAGQYTVTTATTGSGSIALSPAKAAYDQETEVSVTATADPGWEFVGWHGDLSGSVNPETFTMNSNKSVTAQFTKVAETRYTLTTTINGSGTISLDPSGGIYNEGTVVTLSATAKTGWQFDGWSGDLGEPTNPIVVTMNENISVTADFTRSEGDPCDSPASVNLPFVKERKGSYCWVTSGNIRYINSWNMDLVEINGINFTNNYSGNDGLPPRINGNYYIRYESSVDWSHVEIEGSDDNTDDIVTEYSLKTLLNGEGTITLSPAGGVYEEGTNVTATAIAGPGWEFSEWSGDLSGSETSTTITMNASQSVTANFTETGADHDDELVPVSLPFTQEGAGEYHWITSADISYINSWNTDVIEINGADFTNSWSNSIPVREDGTYHIYYKASAPWSHFEINE